MPQYSDISDLQLQLRRLELERETEERQQQFELKKLEFLRLRFSMFADTVRFTNVCIIRV